MSAIKTIQLKGREILVWLQSDQALSVLACLPIFFGWLPLLTWRFENEKLRNLALDSLSLSLFFWLGLFMGLLGSILPWIGGYLANVFHSIGIVIYLIGSGILCFYTILEREIPSIQMIVRFRNRFIHFLEG